jgi:hypothetical protein
VSAERGPWPLTPSCDASCASSFGVGDHWCQPKPGDEPALTRHSDGTLSVVWPDPPRPSYMVSHEVIQRLVDDNNKRVVLWRQLGYALGVRL